MYEKLAQAPRIWNGEGGFSPFHVFPIILLCNDPEKKAVVVVAVAFGYSAHDAIK